MKLDSYEGVMAYIIA